MADIHHYFLINATEDKVFEAVSSPTGLDAWWTKKSKGSAQVGGQYTLDFGPGYEWTAAATKYQPAKAFELSISHADSDWTGTKVGFELDQRNSITHIKFWHVAWREDNEHFRTSNYCWAMYLRLLKRFVEFGEIVKYENRLDA